MDGHATVFWLPKSLPHVKLEAMLGSVIVHAVEGREEEEVHVRS